MCLMEYMQEEEFCSWCGGGIARSIEARRGTYMAAGESTR
jgi:hypothetical protein